MNALDLVRAARTAAPVDLATLDMPALDQALAGYEADLQPLARVDPAMCDRKRRSPAAAQIDDALCAIGAKVASRLPPEKVNAWRDAVMVSLSKWAPSVALAAARAGRHEPFKYGLDDVDARLHELAEEIDGRHRTALARLRWWRAEIARAAAAPPALEHQPMVWTEEAIAQANRAFAKVGAATRYRLAEGGECETYQVALYENGGLAPNETVGYMAGTEGNPED